MRSKDIALSGVVGLLLGATALFAHHSMAMFDTEKVVTYSGTITKFSYANPHVYVFADVQKDGKSVNYRVEADSPYGLRERGWSSRSLKVGDKVTIVSHPTKDNSNFGLLMSITMADGRKLESGPARQDDIQP